MDIRDRLAAHHKSEMAHTSPSDLGAVMDRGQDLKTHRRVLMVAMPVAAAAVLVVGVMALRPDAGPTAADGADQVAAANAVLTVGSSSLDWEAAPATLGWSMQRADSDGIMYVLSTAPGVRWENFPNGNLPEAIYTSADGSNWVSHPLGGTWVSSIAANGGLLYAIGTAPGTQADSVTLQVGVSDNQGATFTTTALAPTNPANGFMDARIAATSTGVLALSSVTLNTDPFALLPPEAVAGDVMPINVDDGIAVFASEDLGGAEEACYSGDPDVCRGYVEDQASYFASWEELGIDPALMESGQQVIRTAYWSADGSTFEETEYPLPEGWVERFFTLDDTAVVSINGMNGSTLLASSDLKTWEPIAQEVTMGWLLDLGMVDDEVVLVGGSVDGSEPVVYRTDDLFGAWTEVDISALVPVADNVESFVWVNSAAVGSGGVAISIGGEFAGSGTNPIMDLIGRVLPINADQVDEPRSQPVGMLLVSRDLAEWSVVSSSELGGTVDSVMFGPTGNLIATLTDQNTMARMQVTATP